MCKELGKTAFIKGGNNEPAKIKTTKLGHTEFIEGVKGKIYNGQAKTPEFVRDAYEQGVAEKNKGAPKTSLIVTHGSK